MNDWNRPNIIQERKAALQIPDACLENLSTKGLLETCLKYPYLFEMWLFNDYQTGFNMMSARFNGYGELFKRPDLVNVLFDKYSQFSEDVKSVYLLEGDERAEFSFRHFALEFMLAQDAVLENLNAEQERELFLLSLEHREITNSIFGGNHFISRALLYAKTVMRDNAAGDYANELSKFIKTPSSIAPNTVKYLDDYINKKYKQSAYETNSITFFPSLPANYNGL